MKNLLVDVMTVLFLLIIGDHVSTYLCLTTPTETYKVWEVNPISAWGFGLIGLVPTLILQLVIKGVALVWAYRWAQRSMLHYRFMWFIMIGAVLITGYVNYNNFYIYMLLRGAQ